VGPFILKLMEIKRAFHIKVSLNQQMITFNMFSFRFCMQCSSRIASTKMRQCLSEVYPPINCSSQWSLSDIQSPTNIPKQAPNAICPHHSLFLSNPIRDSPLPLSTRLIPRLPLLNIIQYLRTIQDCIPANKSVLHQQIRPSSFPWTPQMAELTIVPAQAAQ